MPNAESPLPEYARSRASWTRWIILLGLALASTNAYLSRVCLAAANTTIQRELHLSTETMGQIASYFYLGYLWFQIPSGWVSTRWGTRLILPLFSVWWSVSAAWTGLAAGSVGLSLSRITSGVAQAGLVPASAQGISYWFPHRERGVASSAVATCMTAGGVIATFLTALLLPRVGWRWVFQIYALVGVAWAALFYLGFRNRPEDHAAVSPAELEHIRQDGDPSKSTTKTDNRRLWGTLLSSWGMWMMNVQAFARAFGAAFFITWFPAYLEKSRGVKLVEAGFLSTLPLIGTLAGNAVGGVVCDRLMIATRNRWISRCGLSALALVLCGLSLLAAAFVPNPRVMVVVISLGSLAFGCGSPASWAAGMDISGRHTPLVMAIQNMSGNFGAYVCPIILGFLIGHIERTHGDWNQVLYLFVGVYLAGALAWLLLNPNHSVVERDAAPKTSLN